MPLLTGWLLILLGTGPLCGSQDPVSSNRWVGPDGEALPFGSHQEAVDFLAGAVEVSSKELSTGITKPRKLRLRQNDIEAHAVFHHIDRKEDGKTKRLHSGKIVHFFRDSYRGQISAYEISRLLGMDNVPPTAPRKSAGSQGSAQLWIEGAMTDLKRRERGLEPPDVKLWGGQLADMWVFDNLINNIDRNQGNILIDSGWSLWLIDHSRAFGRDVLLPYENLLTRCSRRMWQALHSLNEEELSSRLLPYLSKGEIKSILKRRDLLVRWFEQRIDRQGEGYVLFSHASPDAATVESEVPPAPSRGGGMARSGSAARARHGSPHEITAAGEK